MEIWAHRGASARQPENTLAAFSAAMAAGADGVEFDVQLSADGVPVVIHDEKVERTHNGSGWVSDYPLAELQALRSRQKKNADHVTTRIPTLAEVLDLLVAGTQKINIELKNSVKAYKGLERQVLAQIAERKLGGRVVLSSFNHYSLRKLAGLGVRSTLGALFGEPLFRPWKYAQKLGVGALHPPCSRPTLSAKLVRRCHESGLKVHLWTVNDRADLEWAARHGVDAVITDTPAKARNLYG